MSGGMVWLPNNPLMQAEGIADSHEDGLAYFDDVIGDIGPASSPARREMFLTAGVEMIDFLLRKGVRLVRCPGWSDYYPNSKGGNAAGRSVEGVPFDAAALGDWSDKVQPSMAKNYGFVLKTNELRSVQYFNRSPRAFAVATRVFLRTRAARLRRREILTNGASFIGQILKVLIDAHGEPPVWTNAAMDDLIVEDGRVVGARVTRDGSTLNVEARKGVLLAAGGFGHNADMRRQYSADQPNEAKWSIANAGTPARCCRRRCASAPRPTCWTRPGGCPWLSSPIRRAASLGSGRQRPGAIYVDGTGKRFCNESNSYVEVGKAMYANKAVPCWQVFDQGYVGRYVVGRQPVREASRARGADREGRHQARRDDRRPGARDRRSRRRIDADGQALQRVRRAGSRPRLRPRPVGLQRLPRRSGTSAERRARAHRSRRRSSRPGSSPATSERAAA